MKRTAKMLTAALLALTLALPGTAAAADDTPAVRISEMMYKNHATLQDADGDFSDWFELENTSNRVVRLKGWSVSDGKTVWDFPADATIPRGGVRVVFASRKDKTAAGESHTSFALGEGETLYLIAPGGTIADRAAWEKQITDLLHRHLFSYGQNGAPGVTYILTRLRDIQTARKQAEAAARKGK